MAAEVSANTSVLAGLELLRRAERTRVCRTLHDQIGPSLCSAGLMVGLLRCNPSAFDAPSGELLASVEDALESAINTIRALTACAEPELATRCGYHSALERLAKAHGVELEYPIGTRAPRARQADAACRILQDVLLSSADGSTRRVEVRRDGLLLLGGRAIAARPFRALRHLAAGAGIVLRRGQATLEMSFRSKA